MVAARARRRLKIDTQRCLEVSGEGDCVVSFFGTQSTPLTAQISLLPHANEIGGAGDHTPSRLCIYLGAEVEGVVGVN